MLSRVKGEGRLILCEGEEVHWYPVEGDGELKVCGGRWGHWCSIEERSSDIGSGTVCQS